MERKKKSIKKVLNWTEGKSEAVFPIKSVDENFQFLLVVKAKPKKCKNVKADYKDTYESDEDIKILNMVSEDAEYDSDASTIPEPMTKDEGTILCEVGAPNSSEQVHVKEELVNSVEDLVNSTSSHMETKVIEDVTSANNFQKIKVSTFFVKGQRKEFDNYESTQDMINKINQSIFIEKLSENYEGASTSVDNSWKNKVSNFVVKDQLKKYDNCECTHVNQITPSIYVKEELSENHENLASANSSSTNNFFTFASKGQVKESNRKITHDMISKNNQNISIKKELSETYEDAETADNALKNVPTSFPKGRTKENDNCKNNHDVISKINQNISIKEELSENYEDAASADNSLKNNVSTSFPKRRKQLSKDYFVKKSKKQRKNFKRKKERRNLKRKKESLLNKEYSNYENTQDAINKTNQSILIKKGLPENYEDKIAAKRKPNSKDKVEMNRKSIKAAENPSVQVRVKEEVSHSDAANSCQIGKNSKSIVNKDTMSEDIFRMNKVSVFVAKNCIKECNNYEKTQDAINKTNQNILIKKALPENYEDKIAAKRKPNSKDEVEMNRKSITAAENPFVQVRVREEVPHSLAANCQIEKNSKSVGNEDTVSEDIFQMNKVFGFVAKNWIKECCNYENTQDAINKTNQNILIKKGLPENYEDKIAVKRKPNSKDEVEMNQKSIKAAENPSVQVRVKEEVSHSDAASCQIEKNSKSIANEDTVSEDIFRKNKVSDFVAKKWIKEYNYENIKDTNEKINQNIYIKEIPESDVNTHNKLKPDKIVVKRKLESENELNVVQKRLKVVPDDEIKNLVLKNKNLADKISVEQEKENSDIKSAAHTCKEDKHENGYAHWLNKKPAINYESFQDMTYEINTNLCNEKKLKENYKNDNNDQNLFNCDKILEKRETKSEIIRKKEQSSGIKSNHTLSSHVSTFTSLNAQNATSSHPNIKKRQSDEFVERLQDKCGTLLKDHKLLHTKKKVKIGSVNLHQSFSSQGVHQKENSLNLANGNNIQVADVGVLIPTHVPTQKVAQPSSHNIEKLSMTSNFHRIHFESASSSSLETQNSQIPIKLKFRNAENKFLSVSQNTRKGDITECIDTLILQWNPTWLQTPVTKGIYPPICDSYPFVKYFYRNETDFYNTYAPLHLLHIWQNIFEGWQKNKNAFIDCKYRSVEKLQHSFKICCSTEKLKDLKMCPKQDDIVWFKNNQEESFVLVENVKRKRITDSKEKDKFKFFLESIKNFDLKPGDEFKICTLSNIDAERLKIKALKSIDTKFKGLVLHPEKYASNIEIVQLFSNKPIKQQRNDILKEVNSEHILVILIETYHESDKILLITQLAYAIVSCWNHQLPTKDQLESKCQTKVLICLKDEKSFYDLIRRLAVCDPVLAVRTKQIMLTPDLMKFTLEERITNGEKVADIVNKYQLFITTFSAFGSAEKMLLSKINKLTCIVGEAHLCTEAETAVVLTLKVDKILLFGKRASLITNWPALSQILRHHRYHISLFERLLKAKEYSKL